MSSRDPAQTEMWTIVRLIEWGADYFRAKRVDSPRLTMELMVAHVLSLRRFDLYMQFDRPLSQEELAALRAMVKRRVAREPLQYILGETVFHGRTFTVRPGVLIPRPETELLVDEALRRSRSLRCLDIGTGSGCIAITVALERPETEVVGIDLSAEAIAVARENAELLGAERIDLRQADIFDEEAIAALGSFDLIISNPPYIPVADVATLQEEVRNHEPHMAVTDGGDGLAFYRRIMMTAPRLLRRDGAIYLELGYGQAAAVRSLCEEAGFEVEIYTDFDKIDRILRARRAEEHPSPLG